MKKNWPYRYGQNFRFGVKKLQMILWFQMIQNGQLKTFYQSRLGIQAKFSDLLRILWVWIFGPKWKINWLCFIENFESLDFCPKMKKNIPCRYGQYFRFWVNKFLMILWFQMLQNGPLKTFYQSRQSIQAKFSEQNSTELLTYFF